MNQSERLLRLVVDGLTESADDSDQALMLQLVESLFANIARSAQANARGEDTLGLEVASLVLISALRIGLYVMLRYCYRRGLDFTEI